MKKALETTFSIFLFFFAIVGVVASVFVIKEFYYDSEYSELYVKNCENVKPGMTLEEAKIVMGGKNYSANKRTYKYWTSFEKGIPKQFSIYYPTSGASFHTAIHFDPNTGIVTEVECSGF
ncbi:hypothetical protein H9Q13_00705 [Pontibacter sp. JH31]|uniref:Uncharacterized protein n=1 Tax=Pontibacter aquaedesilientis TaxID=2766980 RepID=A0ABR7XCP7_9BACT|nr:hypothetical protein [Pontibacter aquaedesilientis]MBD1395671.1 hypothetical protein [Pontibacter aquaedesilientis]